MLEGLKDALEHVEDLARENEKTEVVEICGHTYANKTLRRYDMLVAQWVNFWIILLQNVD